MLGAWIAARLGIPLAASWLASGEATRLPSPKQVLNVSAIAERQAFAGAARFYKMAELLFAPNQELVDMLYLQTGNLAS